MKTKKFLFLITFTLILGMILLAVPQTSSSKFVVGKTYFGFKLLKKQPIKEYNAEGLYFEHLKSGAKLLKIVTKDDNKVFMITFKTLPYTDEGIPHILEHCVLNGSKHFPVKSPFDYLIKGGTLKTFLNAMTSSDHTMYPVSSRNLKDYFNLMHVYLDAVFYPLVLEDERIFKQEGWHYEIFSKDGKLKINGVVYNEMKGAFSSPETYLYYYTGKHLFSPESVYHWESGGFPKAIPNLTYEKFVNFYKEYYHPSNSYIYLYGNAPLMKELEFIDKNYLSNFKKTRINAIIHVDKPFKKIKEVTENYPVTSTSSTKNKTYLSLSFVVGKGIDQNLTLAMDLLSDYLVNLPQAPLRIALREAGIGRDVSAYYESSIKQPVFNITVKNANPGDFKKFKEIVFKVLKDVSRKGVDKKVLLGLLNRKEFALREGRGGYKGLILGMTSVSGWMFADDPFLTVGYEKPLAFIKKNLETGYFEQLIKNKLIKNTHALFLVLKPKKGLAEEIAKDEENMLEELKKKLSIKEIDELIKQTKALKAYQKEKDPKEAIEKLPFLKLSDIEPRYDYYKIEPITKNGIKYLTYPVFTNKIVYMRFFFNYSGVKKELIPYVRLLSDVLKLLNTKNYTFGDLSTEININTGGINFYVENFYINNDPENVLPVLSVYSKSMNDKIDKTLSLIEEIILRTNFDDPKRLKQVLLRLQAQEEMKLNYNGIGIAITRLFSYFDRGGKLDELTSGLSYYKFITKLVRNYDSKQNEIIENLKKVSELIFRKPNLEVGVFGEKSDISNFIKLSNSMISKLPQTKVRYHDYKFSYNVKNEGITSASKVQYVVQGYNYKKLGYKYSGKLRVLNQILSTDYLWNELRVLGGAYGGFSGFTMSGKVCLASYRDPHLKRTLEKYKKSVDYLKNFKAGKDEMARFIIGTLSKYEIPLRADQQGDRAINYYYTGIKKKDIIKEREEILSTTANDIKDYSKLLKKIIDKNYYCVFGAEKKLKEEKKLFTTLIKAKE